MKNKQHEDFVLKHELSTYGGPMMIPFLISNCHLWSTDAVNECQQQRQNAKRLRSVV